ALAVAARALAKAGRPAEAVAAAEKVADPGARSRALADVAEALAKAGRPAEAARAAAAAGAAAGMLARPGPRSRAVADAAEALAKAGKWNEAFGPISRITDEEIRSDAMAKVAISQARSCLFFQARETANLCSSPSDRLSAFTAIVREYSKRKDAATK